MVPASSVLASHIVWSELCSDLCSTANASFQSQARLRLDQRYDEDSTLLLYMHCVSRRYGNADNRETETVERYVRSPRSALRVGALSLCYMLCVRIVAIYEYGVVPPIQDEANSKSEVRGPRSEVRSPRSAIASHRAGHTAAYARKDLAPRGILPECNRDVADRDPRSKV